MSLLVDLGMWLMGGVVVSIVVPILLALVLPPYWADKLSEAAWGLTMSAVGKGLIVLRETTRKPELRRYSENSYLSSLRLRLGGETKHYLDFMDLMGQFKGRPLGMVLEDQPVVVNPWLAEIADLLDEAHASDKGEIQKDETVTRGGDTVETREHYLLGYVPFREDPQPVAMGASKRVVSGDATAEIVSLIKQYTENSQSQFDSFRGTVDYFIWLTALGAGFGLMWLASKTGGTGGGSIPTNPFPAVLGVLPL